MGPQHAQRGQPSRQDSYKINFEIFSGSVDSTPHPCVSCMSGFAAMLPRRAFSAGDMSLSMTFDTNSSRSTDREPCRTRGTRTCDQPRRHQPTFRPALCAWAHGLARDGRPPAAQPWVPHAPALRVPTSRCCARCVGFCCSRAGHRARARARVRRRATVAVARARRRIS